MSRRGISRTSSPDVTIGVHQPDIGALVSELRELYYVKGIELMLRIGELILDRLYGGDITKWKSRGRKDFPFVNCNSIRIFLSKPRCSRGPFPSMFFLDVAPIF